MSVTAQKRWNSEWNNTVSNSPSEPKKRPICHCECHWSTFGLLTTEAPQGCNALRGLALLQYARQDSNL